MKNKKRISKLITKKYEQKADSSCCSNLILSNLNHCCGGGTFNYIPDLLLSQTPLWPKIHGMEPEKPKFQMIRFPLPKPEIDDYTKELKKFPHILDYIIEEGHRQVFNKHLQALQNYLKENLEKFGFYFDSDDLLLKFIGDRITRITFSENPDYYEYYLDFISEEKKGIFIGCSSSKISYEFNQGTLTFTVG